LARPKVGKPFDSLDLWDALLGTLGCLASLPRRRRSRRKVIYHIDTEANGILPQTTENTEITEKRKIRNSVPSVVKKVLLLCVSLPLW
jgi:hypothetical protein